jgi:hypothetical protein
MPGCLTYHGSPFEPDMSVIVAGRSVTTAGKYIYRGSPFESDMSVTIAGRSVTAAGKYSYRGSPFEPDMSVTIQVCYYCGQLLRKSI